MSDRVINKQKLLEVFKALLEQTEIEGKAYTQADLKQMNAGEQLMLKAIIRMVKDDEYLAEMYERYCTGGET